MLEGYGLIVAPRAFDHAQVTGEGLEVVLQSSDQVLVRSTFAKTSEVVESSPVIIEFQARDGAILYSCSVQIVVFDPSTHDPAKLGLGNCDLSQTAGLPQLVVGHVQSWRLPELESGASIAPKRIADVMILDTDQIMPSGNSPGLAMLWWGPRSATRDQTFNLCPIRVTAAEDAAQPAIPDSALCQDVHGAPLRLRPGEIGTLRPRNPDGTPFLTGQFMAQTPGVAEVIGFEKASHGPIVKAVSPGSTSIALLSEGSSRVSTFVCEVIIQ